MVYLFERDDQDCRIEASYSAASRLYEIVRRCGNDVMSESFASEAQFRARLDEIRAQLEAEAWQPAGPPELLDGRWKI